MIGDDRAGLLICGENVHTVHSTGRAIGEDLPIYEMKIKCLVYATSVALVFLPAVNILTTYFP